MHRPRVLFLDEPTTGLDPQNRANLWDQLRLRRDTGTTVFLTTRYLDEADQLSDRLAIIDHGRVIAEGTPAELKQRYSGTRAASLAQPSLDDVFLHETGRSLRDTGAPAKPGPAETTQPGEKVPA
jgi:ABC-2 type transport system ATP-binding protein